MPSASYRRALTAWTRTRVQRPSSERSEGAYRLAWQAERGKVGMAGRVVTLRAVNFLHLPTELECKQSRRFRFVSTCGRRSARPSRCLSGCDRSRGAQRGSDLSKYTTTLLQSTGLPSQTTRETSLGRAVQDPTSSRQPFLTPSFAPS